MDVNVLSLVLMRLAHWKRNIDKATLELHPTHSSDVCSQNGGFLGGNVKLCNVTSVLRYVMTFS